MGLYFRKSISLGHGVRLNFSKNGVGISAGIKGLRIGTGSSGTRLTASIPGTGVYYRKTLSSSSPSNAIRRSDTRYPYEQTVSNDYTGRTRTIRAATAWELRNLVEAEGEKQHAEELRQRNIDYQNDQRELATEMTRQEAERRAVIGKIISQTLIINDRLDWDKQLNFEPYPEFDFNDEIIEVGSGNSLFKKLFNSKKESSISSSSHETREEALKQYIIEKTAYERIQRENNAEIEYLRRGFENGEKLAIEKYASIILTNSIYPTDIDLDFDFEYDPLSQCLLVNGLLPNESDLPIVEEYQYKSSEIKQKLMKDDALKTFFEHTLLSICLRTIHELFEALYNNFVKIIIFNGFLLRPQVSMPVEHIKDDFDFTNSVRKIFEIKVDKETFERQELNDNNVEYILNQFELIRTNSFLDTKQELI